MKDRLNPIAPEGTDDTTLGGYSALHGRAPGFEGSDGSPYTVAVETGRDDSGDGWVAYLVFLRWADAGSAIMGHLETDDLAHAVSDREVRAKVDALRLTEIKRLLDETIERRRLWDAESVEAIPPEAPGE
jgi:hypothetical protein